jgi:hypothetical protein
MIPGKNLFRACLLLLAVLCGVTTVSAWTFQNWSVIPPTTPVQPGTPVSLHYDIHFDSYMTGSTFDSSDSLVMYTELANPHWTMTTTEMMDDGTPIVTSLPDRQSMQARLDGWTLSFVRKRFDLNVQLNGKAPLLNQSQNITLIRVQEMAPNAKPVSGALVKKYLPVFVQAPEPAATTSAPPAPTDTVIDVTMQQATTTGTIVTDAIAPTRKQTYSPGPDPVLACGMLAGLVVLWARRR